MVLVGSIVSILLQFMSFGKDHPHNIYLDFAISIAITILIWEGNLIINKQFDKVLPWQKQPLKRAIIHLITTIVFSAGGIYLSMITFSTFICPLPAATKDGFMLTAIVLGVLISIIVLSIQIGFQFFNNWKKSLIEVEKYKTESLQAQLQNLKSQINPHFLFNNMSVLSSLVYKDQDKAVEFINQLSKVYRYLLDSKDAELVTVEEEMAFIKSYTYLLKIRFDTNIHFKVNVDEQSLKKMIPPMSIQVLVENTIKHNEVSSEQPLTVFIQTEDDKLSVINNIQLRKNHEISLKTGLKNIKDRYTYFTEKSVDVINDSLTFTVKIPLLQTV
jgi:two-component system, LytTR family, sensor kinase